MIPAGLGHVHAVHGHEQHHPGDLAQEHVSTGNSLLAVTQQLSISFGVASSTAVLRLFNALAPGSLLDHFHETFLTVGGVTLLASLVFLFLRRGDGDALLPGPGGAPRILREAAFFAVKAVLISRG